MRHRFIAVIIAIAGIVGTAHAQETPERGWVFSGQLTTVWTAGNSESSTFGMASTLRRIGERDELKLEAGGIRSEATRKTRRAVGTGSAFTIEENEETRKTAEAFFGRGRYDRSLGDRFLAFAAAEALRNTFAGINSRVVASVGAGNVWADSERFRFKTDYGVTWTVQQDVVDNPLAKSSFPGARVSWDLRRVLTTTTRLESVLIGDLNLDQPDDMRVDFTNSFDVSVSRLLSLRPSLQLLWRNQPSLAAVDLFTPIGAPTGSTVTVPLEKLDSFFTLAIVLTL